MYNGDVLGDEGRKALNACVKVKIYGKPETRRYDREATLERLGGCYAPGVFRPWLYNEQYTQHPCPLPNDLSSAFEDHTKSEKATYNIVDIYEALGKCDEMGYFDKYPREGPGSDKLRALIDKRREDIERENEEARSNPGERLKYSWIVAQRRVRDCFAGRFSGYEMMAIARIKPYKVSYNIKDIHDVVVDFDERLFIKECLRFERRPMEERGEGKRLKTLEDINKQRDAIQKELEGAIVGNQQYSKSEAEQCVEGCYLGSFPPGVVILPVKMDESGIPKPTQKYSAFDIHLRLLHFDEKVKNVLDKYPDEGPGSAELRKLIDECRDDLKKEWEMATCGINGEQKLHKYFLCDAERRVRDCFAGTFLNETDIFPTKKDQSGVPKISQAYDIFDIKEALDYFDAKKLCEKYPEEGGPEYDKIKQSVDEQRDSIQREYKTATTATEIENGSGFIVQEHFIITNKHVIETHLNDTGRYEILISNAAINELFCMVACCDAGKDLALLYCPNLNLEQHGICPLQLSNQSLLPGMPIVCFGYPMSHTGETALFVNGNVSGSKETLAGHSMIVLNCSLNSGNSGGPVLHWVNGRLKVVGVATQKHFKEILTLEEMETIEKIRKSLQTRTVPDLPDNHIKLLSDAIGSSSYSRSHFSFPLLQTSFLLTLKLYDALETHSQFNLSNALPGKLVVEFIKNSISKYTGEHNEELAEVVELAKDIF